MAIFKIKSKMVGFESFGFPTKTKIYFFLKYRYFKLVQKYRKNNLRKNQNFKRTFRRTLFIDVVNL